ncbi:MAG: sugar ABC transporter substrate-binding protein [Armatimonadetes bacterium]|nr:sugar ABC transporter substrate-binding protein [Armatimonadota bacterium]
MVSRSHSASRAAGVRPAALALGALGLLSVFLLPGCITRHTDTTPPPAFTTITYAYWALDAEEISLTHALEDRFEAKNPSVQVRLVEVTDRYYDKLTTLFATGNAPDVMSLNYGRMGDFAREGLLADLSGFEGLESGEFTRSAWEAFAGIGPTVGRPGIVGIPRDWGPSNLLVVNVDALAAAGVAEPDPRWTWEQYADACRRLTVRDGSGAVRQYGGAICLYPYAALAWMRQAGGNVLAGDGERSTLSDPANVKALAFLKGLVEEGAIAPPDPARDESLERFQSGKAATAFVTPYSLGDLEEMTQTHWLLAPPLVGVREATGCIPTGIAISSDCEHKAAAFRLLRFLVTEGARQAAARGLCVPAWKPALDALEYGRREDERTRAARILREAVPLAAPHPVATHLAYETMMSELRRALEDVFVRDAEPHQALLRAEKRINSARP